MKNCSQKKEMKEEKTQDKAEKKTHIAAEWWKDLSSIATNSTVDTGLND